MRDRDFIVRLEVRHRGADIASDPEIAERIRAAVHKAVQDTCAPFRTNEGLISVGAISAVPNGSAFIAVGDEPAAGSQPEPIGEIARGLTERELNSLRSISRHTEHLCRTGDRGYPQSTSPKTTAKLVEKGLVAHRGKWVVITDDGVTALAMIDAEINRFESPGP